LRIGITSLKNKSKIKNIFFAQELEKFKRYKIIDLKEYLELSNIAFLINTFRANYTVSNHIEVSKEEYINLRNLMKQFSNNLMALSIDYLLDYVTPNLINSLNEISKKENLLFKSEINNLIKHLNETYSKKAHRYETFYYIAEDVESKGYLAIALSLIFEGLSFYIYSYFRDNNPKIRNFFEKIEKSPKKNVSFYDILDICRNVILIPEERYKIPDKMKKYGFDEELKKEFLKEKKSFFKKVKNSKKFINTLYNARNLRNNLLHANSGDSITTAKKDIGKLLKNYKAIIAL
jgi:hypothetical protein